MLFSIYDFRFSIFSLSRVHLRSSVVNKVEKTKPIWAGLWPEIRNTNL